ncbi:hypothetical protein F0562_029585 [Nyssa sinensis]|uniref:Uncharacterized protein n=1 Tax=Nyssa sinensis TaxID=561372 RepID=A0A5J5B5P0_9ASTE|nr:hypothetical protein F0562_029585 [Nyssa sinensis]
MIGTLCKSFGCKIASMLQQTAAWLEVNSSGSSSPISGTPERSRAVAETSPARHMGKGLTRLDPNIKLKGETTEMKSDSIIATLNEVKEFLADLVAQQDYMMAQHAYFNEQLAQLSQIVQSLTQQHCPILSSPNTHLNILLTYPTLNTQFPIDISAYPLSITFPPNKDILKQLYHRPKPCA